MRGGPAACAGDAAHERAVQGGGLRRGEIGRDHDAFAAQERLGGTAEQVPQDLVTDAAHVGGPGTLVGVVEPFPGRGRVRNGVCPGARRVDAVSQHAVTRRLLKGLVLEKQDVGVEDTGLVVAGAAGHPGLCATDLGCRGGQGSLQRGPVGVAIVCGAVGDATAAPTAACGRRR